MKTRKLAGLAAWAALPVSMFAFSTGPPLQRTGAPADGGLDCSACHRGNPTNDPRGKLTVLARDYRPGVKQIVRVMLEHTEANRWGFQITVRLAGNESQGAGRFAVSEESGLQLRTAAGAEFVNHTQPSTFLGQRGSAFWDIEWTPPADLRGEVVFYAAGNAANFSGNNQGDYIYTTTTRIKAESCNLADRPVITGIVNAASFVSTAFAPNTLITIGGRGFQPPGSNLAVEGYDLIDRRFPNSFGCVAVEVGGRRAPLSFVGPSQINAQIPTLNNATNVPVRVIVNPGTANERASDPVNINVTDYSPAFFRLLPTPCIVALNQDGSLSGDPSLFTSLPVKGARVGEVVSMFATGLGFTEPIWQAGEIATTRTPLRRRPEVSVEFNGVRLPDESVTYAGLAPNLVTGVYQINIRIPANARTNQHNEVRIRAGNTLSPENTTLLVIP